MSDPVSIITGAGSGVGAQIAAQLARLGHRCVLVGRTESKLRDTAKDIGGDPLIVRADIALDSDRARIVDETLERFGRVDTLINNAGLAISKPIHKHDTASMERLFLVNGFGPTDLARRVIPAMLKQRSGVIVSVASMANIDPFPGLGMYGCAKGALSVLPKAIQNEYGSKGIRAYTLCPGAIETGMLRSFISTDMLPESQTLEPARVAQEIVSMVTGETDAEPGDVVPLPSH